jgi:phosphoribosylanthranilate isomerase
MKIKVCGLKYPENINSVAELMPDYMGFICFDASPRVINDLLPDDLDNIPAGIIKTGVFVNESAETINRLIVTYRFDAIQLHGDEDADFCKSFKDKVIVMKAFGIYDGFDFEQLNQFKNSVHYFLFDAKTSIHGGSGLTFDWSLLNQYKLDIPFFLSGGLSPENLAEVKEIKHPQFYGVDLNSKFEIEPGLKDINKLKKAFELLR